MKCLLNGRQVCRIAAAAASATSARLSPPSLLTPKTSIAPASSSSSTRWKSRQTNDHFAREARVAGLKSRAAFKLLELDSKHHIFRKGGTVVDLGYAPGSWSQVAVSRTSPGGRVVGIDIIPAQPPRGASSIQGNFLSPHVQAEVRSYVRDPALGRARVKTVMAKRGEEEDDNINDNAATEEDVEAESRGILEMAQEARSENAHHQRDQDQDQHQQRPPPQQEKEDETQLSVRKRDVRDGRVVDVVLSDMSAPWEQTTGHWIRSVSNPYFRMMNTSGTAFRDHAGSMVSLVVYPLKPHLFLPFSLLLPCISSIYSLFFSLPSLHHKSCIWLKWPILSLFFSHPVGPLQCCLDFLLRYPPHRRPLYVQILPRLRRQGL
jgi:21S rRNA (uridine2791-2'-O)-methyltransferase